MRFRDRARIHRAALDRAVAGEHHHLASADHADADDQRGLRHLAVVLAAGGERGQLEERRARVEQELEPLAHEQLLVRAQPVDVALRADVARRVLALAQFGRELEVVRAVRLVRRGAGVDVRLDAAHGVIPPRAASATSRAPRSKVWFSATNTRSTVPSRRAAISVCIFMLSMTSSGWPLCTASPSATMIFTTVPGIGAVATASPPPAARCARATGSTTSSSQARPNAWMYA